MNDGWRVFVPCWQFFDRVGPRARVYTREDGSAEWTLALSAPPRRWWRILFNPAGNLHHADQNLVERLLSEIAAEGVDATNLVDLTSYQILARRLGEGRAFKIEANGVEVLRST